MFGRIVYISDNVAHVEVPKTAETFVNLMNRHVVFEDENKRILGEVEDVDENIVEIRFLGEFANNSFIGGVISKPTLNSSISAHSPMR